MARTSHCRALKAPAIYGTPGVASHVFKKRRARTGRRSPRSIRKLERTATVQPPDSRHISIVVSQQPTQPLFHRDDSSANRGRTPNQVVPEPLMRPLLMIVLHELTNRLLE